MRHITSIFRIIGRLGWRRALLLLLALTFNSLLEGFGIATLVPLILLAMGQDGAMPPIAVSILEAVRAVGLPRETWVLALLAAGALVLREFLSFVILTWAGYIIADTEARLRLRLMREIVQARWTWFHEQQLGGTAISLADFTARAAQAMELAVKALTLLFRTLVYVALIVLVSPLLAVMVLLAGILLFTPLFILIRLTRKYSGRYAGFTANLSARFADVFASVKTIKAMGLEEGIRPLFERFIARLRKYRRRVMLTSYGLTALQNIVAIILIFSSLYLAVNWLGISVVEVGMVAGLTLSVAKNFSRAQNMMQKVAELAPYLRRVEDLTTSAHEAREHETGGGTPHLEHAIRLQDVSFSYPGKPVLENVSFSIPVGAITVLTGPSGAGKTTIIDLVTGLIRPDAGRIMINGDALRDIDMKKWRRMIGYVPQELILLSGSVRDNIRLGTEVSDADIWRALKLAGAADFVRELPEGLDTDLGERGVKLSGGQRQRLSLARALVRRPKLLILDEVTSALDPETERKLVEQVVQLARRQGITVIAITHTRRWQEVADRIVRLQEGRVRVEDGAAKAADAARRTAAS